VDPTQDDPGADLVDAWLGIIVATLMTGGGLTIAGLAYFFPDAVRPWGPVAVAVGLLLLLAMPLGAAWATRRVDWQPAGVRAVGVGIVAAAVSAPLVSGLAALAGLSTAGSTAPIVAAAGIGAGVAAALRPTSPFSMIARGVAVALVLIAPVGVVVAGEVLGPQPASVARSMWLAAPLGIIPIVGVGDLAGHAMARLLRRPIADDSA
jgi:hypothetical protein